MANPFENSDAALSFFQECLRNRGIVISEVKTIKVSISQGKFVYQKQIWTQNNEIYHVKYWTKRWLPKDSSKVSDFAKPLDEKLKMSIKLFGNGDNSASGLNENTLLDLLELSKKGYQTYLITIYQTGEILWCRAEELYYFSSRFGLIPQFSSTYGEPFCWIPTGWLKNFEEVVINYPGTIK